MSIAYTLYLRYCSYFKKASNEKKTLFFEAQFAGEWKAPTLESPCMYLHLLNNDEGSFLEGLALAFYYNLGTVYYTINLRTRCGLQNLGRLHHGVMRRSLRPSLLPTHVELNLCPID